MPAGGGARGARARRHSCTHNTAHSTNGCPHHLCPHRGSRRLVRWPQGRHQGHQRHRQDRHARHLDARLRAPLLPRRLPPLVRTSRRGDDATRHARGGRSKNPPGRAFRRSRPAIAPSRTRPRERARRDETSAAERSPTVSGGVRRLFSPPAPRVPDPAPLARDPRHTA